MSGFFFSFLNDASGTEAALSSLFGVVECAALFACTQVDAFFKALDDGL